MGWRHYLHLDTRRLALFGARPSPVGSNQWRIHWQLLGPMADKFSLLDLQSRRVIALSWFEDKPLPGKRWAVSNRMKRNLAIRALKMAIAFRSPPEGCIYYPAGDCKAICREGITRIAVVSIVRMIIDRSCANTNLRCPLSWFASKPLPGSG